MLAWRLGNRILRPLDCNRPLFCKHLTEKRVRQYKALDAFIGFTILKITDRPLCQSLSCTAAGNPAPGIGVAPPTGQFLRAANQRYGIYRLLDGVR